MGVQIPPWEGAIFRERKGCPIVKYRDTLQSSEPVNMPFGLWAQIGPGNRLLDRSSDSPWEGQFWGKGPSITDTDIGTFCSELCRSS